MNEKELREKQNAEIRRREGLEDATCTDPACNGFKCNKRYHLMAYMGNMIVANLADDEEKDAGKAVSLESPPPEDTAKRCPPNCPVCTDARQELAVSGSLTGLDDLEEGHISAAVPATKSDEFVKQVCATDLGENGDALLTMRDDSVVRVHDLRRDGVTLRHKDSPITVHAHSCWDRVPKEALPEVFYGSSPLGLANCRCQKKA